MIVGDLPPSSSDRRLKFPVEAATIARAVWVEPVNEILSTRGWATSAAPASDPSPVTRFTTPAGNPASSTSSISLSVVSEVCSAGLITTVQPAAMAGASFATAIVSGTFHGTISPATPTGSREVNVCHSPGSESGSVSPVILVAQPAL